MITLRTASTDRVVGRGGWLLLAIGGTTAIQQLGYFAVGAFLHDIAADVGTTVAVVGQVPALMTLAAAPLTLAVGPVADRVGYRPFLLFAMGAVAVYAAGTALAGDYALLLAMGLVGALGRAITSPVAQAVAAANFTGQARRRAMAITMAGVSGAAVVGIPLLTGIAASLGWRGAFGALALMGAAGVALVWLAVPHGGGSGPVDARTLLGQPLTVLGHGPTRGLLLATALRAGSVWIFYTYMGAFLVDRYGFGIQQIGWAYALVGAALLAGTLAGGTGRLSRLPLRALVVASAALMGPCLAGAILFPLGLGLALVLVALNCVVGAAGSVAGTTLLTEETPGGRATTLTLGQAAISLGSAGGSSLGGLLIALGGYEAIGLTVPILALGSALLVLVSGRGRAPSASPTPGAS